MEKHVVKLRATLDSPGSMDHWIQAILLVESFKLVPRPFDEGPRPKSGKLRLNMAPVLEGKSDFFEFTNQDPLGPGLHKWNIKLIMFRVGISWDQNTIAKRRAGDLENQESGQGPQVHTLQLKDSICFTWVQIGS